MWSYFTSSTRSGRSGVKPRSLPALQRLWVPGTRSGLAVRNSLHLPHGWSSIGQTSGCSSSISSARRAAVKLALTPMCCSSPSAYRPEQQAAEQRLLGGRGLVLAVAGDHDVGGALVLDLQHRAGVRDVRRSRAASRSRRRARRPRTPRTTARPRRGRWSCGSGSTARRGGRAPPPSPRGARRTAGRRTTRRPARAGRRRRSRRGSSRASMSTRRLGRVDALLQDLELQAVRRSATKSSPSSTIRSGSCSLIGGDDLGEVAGQRLGVAAGQLDLVAVAEDEAAEAVPLGLEGLSRPCLPGRDPLDRLGEHRLDGRHHGQVHAADPSPRRGARTTAAGRRRTTRRPGSRPAWQQRPRQVGRVGQLGGHLVPDPQAPLRDAEPRDAAEEAAGSPSQISTKSSARSRACRVTARRRGRARSTSSRRRAPPPPRRRLVAAAGDERRRRRGASAPATRVAAQATSHLLRSRPRAG